MHKYVAWLIFYLYMIVAMATGFWSMTIEAKCQLKQYPELSLSVSMLAAESMFSGVVWPVSLPVRLWVIHLGQDGCS